MHFWVSTTRGGFQVGFCWPRKIGTNWFMPALVKRRLGASGKSDDDGTIACCFSRKKLRKLSRISAPVMPELNATFSKTRELPQSGKGKQSRRFVFCAGCVYLHDH